MRSLLSILLATALGMGSAHAEAITVTKGTDGSASGQFKNPSKVTITADPGFISPKYGAYLQTQSYNIPVFAKPGAGWKVVKATYLNPSGQPVEISFAQGPVGNRQFTINVLPRADILNSIVTVRFATLRLTPAGIPDYTEDVTITARAAPNLDELDLNNNGMSDTWEGKYFGWGSADPLDDSDGDGLTNLGESNAKTSPFLKDNPIVGLKVEILIR
jgi:hypothetical protein